MYYVYKHYEDNYADVVDLQTNDITTISENNLRKLALKNDIYGVSLTKDKSIYSITDYIQIEFPTTRELYEYIRENNIESDLSIQTPFGYSLLLEVANSSAIPVEYYVYYEVSGIKHYISKNGETIHQSNAKAFTKKAANQKAFFATKNSDSREYSVERKVK